MPLILELTGRYVSQIYGLFDCSLRCLVGVYKPVVAHCDLSSSNVLVKADGSCTLCDFGCSTVLQCQSLQGYSGTVEVCFTYTLSNYLF